MKEGTTLPETNMETQKRVCKDYSPFKRGYLGFHVSLEEGIVREFCKNDDKINPIL